MASIKYQQDDIVLKVGGREIKEWETVSITASIDRIPRTFELGVLYSAEKRIPIPRSVAGEPCEIFVGPDRVPVLTGYVDRPSSRISATEHEVTFGGRGMCQDLVECSATYTGDKTQELFNVSFAVAATKIAANYGISVTSGDRAKTTIIKSALDINVGDRAINAIYEINRTVGCLVREDEQGNLVLDLPGGAGTSNTVINYARCIEANVLVDFADAFSSYEIYASAEAQHQEKFGKVFVGTYTSKFFNARQTPKGAPRVRNYAAIINGTANPQMYSKDSFQQTYCNWYAHRMEGRAQAVSVVLYGWRDDDGKLWQPNRLVNVLLPDQNVFKGDEKNPQPLQLLISEVVYRKSIDNGTTCVLTMMPPDAFSPAPAQLPYNQDLAAAAAQHNASSKDGDPSQSSAAPTSNPDTSGDGRRDKS